MSKKNIYYELAEKAAQHERNQEYEQAYEYWLKAQKYAPRLSLLEEWAVKRADHCHLMAHSERYQDGSIRRAAQREEAQVKKLEAFEEQRYGAEISRYTDYRKKSKWR